MPTTSQVAAAAANLLAGATQLARPRQAGRHRRSTVEGEVGWDLRRTRRRGSGHVLRGRLRPVPLAIHLADCRNPDLRAKAR